ncbi:MAG: FAD-binding protein [Myxococcota bacterium]
MSAAMNPARDVDVVIAGAGPVGMMCALLGERSGLSTLVCDGSSGPLAVGRADALNARTLQLLELVDLFDELYPLGLPCNTSSVFADGKFVSRQSAWWNGLEGCFHKHFLMLGQAYVERALDARLTRAGAGVLRETTVEHVEVVKDGCLTTLSTGEVIRSKYVIGADGSRSRIREQFGIGFEITRPQIVWAVIDGIIDSDFPKVPEIINFQTDTSDVAWIPREGNVDRFYVRMDQKDFEWDEAISKIKRAVQPYRLDFSEIVWSSQFSVKESVAERYSVADRDFLAGDACHIHSVNGGQGLNTGLGDAFNLMWKLNAVVNHGASVSLLRTYEGERKSVALSVVETSGELVRATKYSAQGTHAEDYVDIVKRRADYVTGMGIRYGTGGLPGQRLHDFEVVRGGRTTRAYSLLDYAKFTLLIFSDDPVECSAPDSVNVQRVRPSASSPGCIYENQAVLVRPDAYIESSAPATEASALLDEVLSEAFFA